MKKLCEEQKKYEIASKREKKPIYYPLRRLRSERLLFVDQLPIALRKLTLGYLEAVLR
jgi:hypothetical protein